MCLPGAAQAPLDRPNHIENWPAPLMWRPTSAGAGRGIMAALPKQAAVSVTSAPAVFVATTPCRVVDTRSGAAPFGAPAFGAQEIRTLPLPQSTSCMIPSSAVAYSLNIAVVPTTSTMRWLTAWDAGSPQPDTATLNDKAGLVTSNAAIIPAGTGGAINVYVTDPTNVVIDINGYYVSNTPVITRQAAALLKWFPVYSGVTFTVGSGPNGLAFDGSNLWVLNATSHTVTELRTSDGAVLGTFSQGLSPYGIAFDGANVWVANFAASSVTKLRASDGVALGTFGVGTGPIAIASDGANVWVANSSANTVTRLRAADGANLGTFAVGNAPSGFAFDGANMWVTNKGDGTVTELRASDGANLGTFKVGNFPFGATYDGANIWVVNGGDDTVSKVRASDGTNLGTFAVGTVPVMAVFDGSNVWITNSVDNTVTKLRASDGLNLGTFSAGRETTGIAFDGTNIWVANYADGTVSKL